MYALTKITRAMSLVKPERIKISTRKIERKKRANGHVMQVDVILGLQITV